MPNEQLLAYIRSELARGVSRADLIPRLLQTGWKVEDVNAALNAIDTSSVAPAAAPVAVSNATSGELPGVFALIKAGIAIYRERFGVLVSLTAIQIPIYLIFFLISVVLGTFTTIIFIAELLHSPGAWIFLIPVIIVVAVLVSWPILWVVMAEMHTIRGHEEKIGFSKAFGRARPQVWPFIWTGFLFYVVVLVPMIVLGALGLFKFLGINSAVLLIFVGLYAVVIFISYLYVASRLGFFAWVIIDGRARGIGALRESLRLTKGLTRSVFNKIFGIGLAQVGIALVLNIVVAIAKVGGTFVGDIAQIINVLISLFVLTPVTIAATYVLYTALVAKSPTT